MLLLVAVVKDAVSVKMRWIHGHELSDLDVCWSPCGKLVAMKSQQSQLGLGSCLHLECAGVLREMLRPFEDMLRQPSSRQSPQS